jgi:hypothetical protein
MNPSQPQFGSNPLPPLKVGESRNGVTVKPGFSDPNWKAPTGGKSWETPLTPPHGDRITQRPLPINSSRGGTETSRYAEGRGYSFGEPFTTPPSGRPKPGQGVKVTGTDGKPTVIGGPKGALGGGGLRGGPLGGGGAFGKIK